MAFNVDNGCENNELLFQNSESYLVPWHSALDLPTDYSTCIVDTVFLEQKILSSIEIIICYDNRCDTNSLHPKPKTGMQISQNIYKFVFLNI